MNPCLSPVLASLPLVLVGCSDSGASTTPPPPVLATAVIGPAGGVLLVEEGAQNGLVLTVPAGAVDEPTEFRVIDEDAEAIGVAPTSVAQVPGVPFRIEPTDLVLPVAATLRVPYRPTNVFETAPGNVRLMHESPWTVREYEPMSVDVGTAELAVEVKTFGSFHVVNGPIAMGAFEYAPQLGDVANFAGGYSFAVEPVASSSPFAADGGELWRITGPGVDESLIFVNGRIVGRRADPDAWREIWSETPVLLNQPVPYGAQITLVGTQILADYESPVGTLPIGSHVMLWSVAQFDTPQMFGGRPVVDILRLTVGVAYQQPFLSGERWLRFYLSPDEGLVALSLDGVLLERIP